MYKLNLGTNLLDMTLVCFKPNIIKFFIIFILLLNSLSCDNDDLQIVPEIPVYLELNLNDELLELGVGMIITITPDSLNKSFSFIDYHDKKHNKRHISWKTYGNGLILYRRDFYSYQAFDRTCTYKAFEEYCGLELGNNSLVPYCPCCKSEFLITADGSPSNTSKATKLLMQYGTSLINNNTRLIISK
jgi:hypothetical protein